MNGKNKVITTYGLYAVDILCVVISFVLSTYMRFRSFNGMSDKDSHFLVCLIAVLFVTLYTFAVPWHNLFMRRRNTRELWLIIKMNLIMMLVIQAIMYFFKWSDTFSRLVMIFFMIINTLLTFVGHMVFKSGMKVYYASDLAKAKVLVFTEAEYLEKVKNRLNKSLDISYEILDYVLLEDMPENYLDNATQMALDEIFIYAPDFSQSKLIKIIQTFDEMGVSCNYSVELPGLDRKRSSSGEFANYSVAIYNHFQKSYKKLLIKRAMDILGGFVGCIITIIFFPFVALAIKLDSKGPVLFSQIRIGRNGRRFKIWKYRSMYIDAEERKKELEAQNEVAGLMFKMENDPRITKVGRFIRKTSIDELPQFFNILKGDMSLIGTRPPTVDEFEKYNQYYKRRLSMTPGLTGMWQVSGRSNIDDFDEVVKLDLEYIDNWSLMLDCKILLKTVKVVFTGRGSK